MKNMLSFLFVFTGAYGMVYAERNPFDFVDDQCKQHFVFAREIKERTVSEEQKKWNITETKNNSTHIIQDTEGNIRAISIEMKN